MGSESWVDLEFHDLNTPICLCVCMGPWMQLCSQSFQTLDNSIPQTLRQNFKTTASEPTTTYLFCADCSAVGSCRTAMITNGCHVMN